MAQLSTLIRRGDEPLAGLEQGPTASAEVLQLSSDCKEKELLHPVEQGELQSLFLRGPRGQSRTGSQGCSGTAKQLSLLPTAERAPDKHRQGFGQHTAVKKVIKPPSLSMFFSKQLSEGWDVFSRAALASIISPVLTFAELYF